MMTSTASDPVSVFQEQASGNVLRPRPSRRNGGRLSPVRGVSSASIASAVESESGNTSGHSTPIPENAPPSTKLLSSVRKQVRNQHRRRLFPTIEYASRVSHFDPASDYRDFHGFFSLFWIGLAIMAITTILRNIKDTGSPFRIQIWTLFTIKTWHLPLVDLVMVASTAISMPFHSLFRNSDRIMTWNRGGMVLQSIYQALWLLTWVAIPFLLEWTWTAQVFLLLHAMVMLMKMHSWAFYNGHLSETEKRLRALDHPATASREPAVVYEKGAAANAAAAHSVHQEGKSSSQRTARGLSPNPDAELSELRETLALELVSPMGNVTYPANLTWANWCDYILCPTLCYELEYPRVTTRKYTRLLSYVAATFGCIFLLTIVSEEFILPVLVESQDRLAALASSGRVHQTAETLLILAETISWLLFPFMLTFLLVFLVIFEYVLGFFAEFTLFGDRHFYSDWWNSTDWMEFSREWNVPVHSFLRRHVYGASRPYTGRAGATVLTFLVSAFGHELIMACISKKVRGYGFVCQMMQLPLVAIQRTEMVRGHHTINNVMFWCSMILGLSLICSLYVLL
ncbi:putative sterol O-acyltransferase 2 [Ceratocystis lukuohia]|uniref:O-acyltransferase n=1 Tax=Ceratocystis lukuohia TaxID=2019550 RepID=A0ABR4MJ07_9PEZI